MRSSIAAESYVVNLAAGAAAALIGLLSFWIFHTLWIANIPAVLSEGAAYAAAATLALAWAVRAARACGRFRGSWRDGLLLGLLLWSTLIPYELVGCLWGHWPDPETFGQVARLLWLAFVGVPVGAAIGWSLGRRAWLAGGVATLAVHFSLRGGIAFNGGRGVVLGLFFWMLPTHLLAGVALVGTNALFVGNSRLRGNA